MKMDLRIPKIPKNEDDLNEISKQLEHEHNNPEDLEHVVAELIGELQSIENRLTQSETDAKKLKEEISKIYLVLSKMILLVSSNNEEDKIKNLKDLLSLLR
jgi:septal ring factor EnvC (AmiA/AmiB activator)